MLCCCKLLCFSHVLTAYASVFWALSAFPASFSLLIVVILSVNSMKFFVKEVTENRVLKIRLNLNFVKQYVEDCTMWEYVKCRYFIVSKAEMWI